MPLVNPPAAVTGGREVLTANRTYYVRSDGNNSNDGLSNTSGGAFLTIQKAIDTAAALDLSVYNVSISVGAGTFAPFVLKSYIGAGSCSITGAGVTTIISATSDNAIAGTNAGAWSIGGMKVQTTTSGSGVFVLGATFLTINATFEFGACATIHLRVSGGATCRIFAYTISGGSQYHYLAESGGRITCVSVTVTLTGTPAFSAAFASASKLSSVDVEAVTWSGSATGTRYIVNTNSIINTVTGSGTTLPGNAAGSAASGGQYT